MQQSYIHKVIAGECYVYSIRSNGERIATVALIREQGRPVPQQIRGACNVEAPGEIKAAVRRWLRSNSQAQHQCATP